MNGAMLNLQLAIQFTPFTNNAIFLVEAELTLMSQEVRTRDILVEPQPQGW